MIRKEGNKFRVVSRKGKNLGGPYDTEEQAQERLAQVERFKNMDKSYVVMEKAHVRGHFATIKGKRVWVTDYDTRVAKRGAGGAVSLYHRETVGESVLKVLKSLLNTVTGWKAKGPLTDEQRKHVREQLKKIETQIKQAREGKNRAAVMQALSELTVAVEEQAHKKPERLDVNAIRMTPEEKKIGEIATRAGKPKPKKGLRPSQMTQEQIGQRIKENKEKIRKALDWFLAKAEIKGKPGLALLPSKLDPKQKRWQRIAPRARTQAGGYEKKPILPRNQRPAGISWRTKVKPSGKVYNRQKEKVVREPAEQYAPKKFQIIGSSANLTFRQQVEKHGHASILGQKVNSAAELNTICQVYRNPIYETQRIIMLNNDNVVVGVTAVSSHRPMESEAFPMKKPPANPLAEQRAVDQAIVSLQQAMKRTGATKYYLQHNHPSGRIDPSGQDPNAASGDIPLTKYYDRHLRGLQGQLIIDHKKFTVIGPHGEFTQHTSEGAEQPDPLQKQFKVHPALGEKIGGPTDIFRIVQDYQLKKDGYYVLLVRRGTEGVSGLMEVPKEYFKDRATAEKAIWKFALLGGGEPFVWGATMGNKVMETLMHYGVVRDVVTPNGESYANYGHSQTEYSPPKKVFIKEEEVQKALIDKMRARFKLIKREE